MKKKLILFAEKMFLHILFCTAILISGCASQRSWVYRSNNYPEQKATNETVTILPFVDARENSNISKVGFYFIPLVPFGWQIFEVPEGASVHIGSRQWTNYNPKEDFAKALSQELKSANLFREAYFSYSKGEGNLTIEGKIITTKYTGKMFSYGLSVYGSVFWFLGAPAVRHTNELSIELTVKNNKNDNVLFSKSYTAPKYKKLSWIYSMRSDFNYAEMLSGIYKQFIEDYKNQIKSNIPQQEKQKTREQNPSTTKSKTDRIRELKQMFDEKLIIKEEYEKEKRKILDEKE